MGTRLAAIPLCLALPSGALRAQDEATCAAGEACGQVAVYGAWGLIALGLLFFLVLLAPARPKAEEGGGRGGGRGGGLRFLRILQARIEKETTGWRRWQWPLLGLFFAGLGVATLLGWR